MPACFVYLGKELNTVHISQMKPLRFWTICQGNERSYLLWHLLRPPNLEYCLSRQHCPLRGRCLRVVLKKTDEFPTSGLKILLKTISIHFSQQSLHTSRMAPIAEPQHGVYQMGTCSQSKDPIPLSRKAPKEGYRFGVRVCHSAIEFLAWPMAFMHHPDGCTKRPCHVGCKITAKQKD